MKSEYILGKNSLIEALKANVIIKKIYVDKKKEKILNLFFKNNLKKLNIPIFFKNKEYLDNLVGNSFHKGIVGVIFSFKYESLKNILFNDKNKKRFFIILDHIEDPYNFGSIIRTSVCGGVSGIIIPKNRSIKVNSTVVRISAGAVFHIPIIQSSNLINSINFFKKENYWIYGSCKNGKKNLFNIKFNKPIVLILGNEKKGISFLIKKNCDELIKIPQSHKIDSLNVGVSAGLLIYKIFENNYFEN